MCICLTIVENSVNLVQYIYVNWFIYVYIVHKWAIITVASDLTVA